MIKLFGLTASLVAVQLFNAPFEDSAFGAVQKSLQTAIDGQKAIGDRLETLESKIGQQEKEILGDLQGSVKKALEELEKTRKDHYTLEERMNAMKLAHKALIQERNYSFGSPVDVIARDEEKALRFLGTVASLVHAPISAKAFARMKEMGICDKALTSTATPGSNFITPDLMNDIYNTLLSFGAYRRFHVVRTNTRETYLPLTTARPVASWVTSEGTGPSADSTHAGSKGTLTMKEILCHVPVALALIEDAEADVVADLINLFGEAFGYIIDNTLFNAETTDNATYGGFNGIINQASATTAVSGNTTVATTDYDDWLNAYVALDAGVVQRGVAEWSMHPAILAKTMLVKDGSGRPVMTSALNTPDAKTIMNILGFPANPVGVMPSTDSAGATLAVVGDPKGAAVGIRKDLDIASSDHSGWANGTRDFRLRARAGVLVRKAGAFRKLKTAAS